MILNFLLPFFKKKTKSLAVANKAINQTNSKIVESFRIPEPTRSLLWTTDEDTEKISSPLSIKMTFDIANQNVHVDDGHNFFGEPSLIWSQLPIKENSELETKPMYYPSYSAISPIHRYQYLKWLTDITQATNLSYVFLYYYGLERHLLVGNFELAFDEILRLLQHHDSLSFKNYASSALITALAYRKKPEYLEKAPFLLEDVDNLSLVLRKMAGINLKPIDLIGLANAVGFRNKRYIKNHPDLFIEKLNDVLNMYQNQHGDILQSLALKTLPKEDAIYFANLSLPDKIRTIPTPQVTKDEGFKDAIYSLLQQAHDEVKIVKKQERANKN